MNDPDARARHLSGCLVRVATDRSRADFAELFAHFAPRLKTFLSRRGASEGEAEDLVQDIMATVWAKAAQYDPQQASVSTWIYRIARNRQIDAFRKSARPKLDPEDPILQPSPADLPDAQVMRAEAEAGIRAALRTLPAEQVDVLRASFYEGLPHVEIAKRLGLPLGTVKSRLRLAFARLRKTLDQS